MNQETLNLFKTLTEFLQPRALSANSALTSRIL